MKKIVYLMLVIVLVSVSIASYSQSISFIQHDIDDYPGIGAVYVADINNDGLLDIVAGAEGNETTSGDGIHWWINNGDNTWTKKEIDSEFKNNMSVEVDDIDGDGNLDVLATSWVGHQIAFWKNSGGSTISWEKVEVASNYQNAHDAHAVDINGDGLKDIIGVSRLLGEVTIWYQGTDESWTEQTIDNDFYGGRAVAFADLDGDNDIDIAAVSTEKRQVAVYINEGGETIEWTKNIIEKDEIGGHEVICYDADFDGDMDLLVSSVEAEEISLWKNNGGDPIVWTYEKASDLKRAMRAVPADIDFDADLDIIATGRVSTEAPGHLTVLYNENSGSYLKEDINNQLKNFWAVYVIDMDGDMDLDIVAGASGDGVLKWWENDLIDESSDFLKANIKSDYYSICNGSTITFTDASYGEVDSYEWNFGADATPSAAKGIGPHEVVYSTTGTKTVSLKITGLSGSNTTTKEIQVVDKLTISVFPENPEVNRGEKIGLVASGGESYFWTPSEGLNVDNSASVWASPRSSTEYIVNSTMGSCAGEVSINVTVNVNELDDVCDAQQIEYGSNGTYNNYNATIESNEPFPGKGTNGDGCVSQDGWCDNAEIENTVWFKFIAPESGEVSIEVNGFDSQIAVYDAETCDDLLNNNYEILAANDDKSANDGNSYIDNLSDLTPGKTYWLQVDGSSGGVNGQFSIVLTEVTTTSINDVKSSSFNIYPNPASDYLNLFVDDQFTGDVELRLIDLLGNVVYKDYYHKFTREMNWEINTSALTKGVYFVEMHCTGFSSTKRLLIN